MNKTILITGCSSGIGYDAATHLKKVGWRVFATCRKEDDCNRLKSEGLETFLLDYEKSDTIDKVIKEINPIEKKGGFQIILETKNGEIRTEIIPPGPDLLVKIGQNVDIDEPLTNNPNVGGFGQAETEIVLQSPTRIYRLLFFFRTAFLTQIFLVFKKKQFEKVQLAEMNFLNYL